MARQKKEQIPPYLKKFFKAKIKKLSFKKGDLAVVESNTPHMFSEVDKQIIREVIPKNITILFLHEAKLHTRKGEDQQLVAVSNIEYLELLGRRNAKQA